MRLEYDLLFIRGVIIVGLGEYPVRSEDKPATLAWGSRKKSYGPATKDLHPPPLELSGHIFRGFF